MMMMNEGGQRGEERSSSSTARVRLIHLPTNDIWTTKRKMEIEQIHLNDSFGHNRLCNNDWAVNQICFDPARL